MANLHAEGVNPFDGFARTTGVPVLDVVEASDRNPFHRVIFDLPESDWSDFSLQAEESMKFLLRWETELKDFVQEMQVNSFQLNFVLVSRLGGGVWVQNDWLPPDLVAMCGRLGIGIGLSTHDPESLPEY